MSEKERVQDDVAQAIADGIAEEFGPKWRFGFRACFYSLCVVLMSVVCCTLLVLSWVVAATIERWQGVLQ